jgi:predicted Fe-Mo cluster-binding NifX family protein
MRIAIPVTDGHLCRHFGHCEIFAFFDVDSKSKQILKSEEITAPAHQPGLLPPWLKQHGVTHVIAGGLGSRARDLLNQVFIEIVGGAPSDSPEDLVRHYLGGTLLASERACDHSCDN